MKDFNMRIETESFAVAELKACKAQNHAVLVVNAETRWNASALRELASALGAVAGMIEAQSPS